MLLSYCSRWILNKASAVPVCMYNNTTLPAALSNLKEAIDFSEYQWGTEGSRGGSVGKRFVMGELCVSLIGIQERCVIERNMWGRYSIVKKKHTTATQMDAHFKHLFFLFHHLPEVPGASRLVKKVILHMPMDVVYSNITAELNPNMPFSVEIWTILSGQFQSEEQNNF